MKMFKNILQIVRKRQNVLHEMATSTNDIKTAFFINAFELYRY